jgi:hemolysin III
VIKSLSLDRTQSLGEEIANSVSHGVALLCALVAAPFLLASTARHGAAMIVGSSVFVFTVVLLYVASTLYHALGHRKAKSVFRVIDHAAIFLLIAGTYTPFTLGVLRGAWGWSLLAIVWSLALAGVLNKAVGGVRHPIFSTLLYLGMGWLVVIAFRPLMLHMPLPGLLLVVAGGLAYTVGAAFYAAKRVRYAHFVFHLLVSAGTTCHFIAVWCYAA